MTNEEMQAQIKALMEENASLKAKKERALSFKVGAKGGVSVYGLNSRFPVTLYRGQWDRLIGVIPDLQKFIETNRDKLAEKE